MTTPCASVAVAGLGGDTGKTFVALGLAAAWARKGLRVAPFKKGPDYIDAAWLTLAAAAPCRNLDTFLMADAAIHRTWDYCCQRADVAVIEGNRGLFDGLDARGAHSTAELAKKLHTPVLLVLDATKVTRTLAAIVHGVAEFDLDLTLAGVVLNRVGGARHETVAREAIETYTDVPVVGTIPRLRDGDAVLPGRHLGLLTVDEHPTAKMAIDRVREVVEQSVDMDALLLPAVEESREGGPLTVCILPFRETRDGDGGDGRHRGTATVPIGDWLLSPGVQESSLKARPGIATPGPVRIGVVRDSAFSFYYPENLESLRRGGADVVMVDALRDHNLPSKLDALYIGGGFPETHARRLSNNRRFLESLKQEAENGLPIYAECGGLMLLCATLEYENEELPMAGVFPLRAQWSARPAGHGYSLGVVDAINPFYPVGTKLRGHEFHHSTLAAGTPGPVVESAIGLSRGTGVGQQRDGIMIHNTLALYTHVHASGTPEWAEGMLNAARMHRQQRKGAKN